ncbi:DUF3592 domain-containing protein [Leisingera sp. S132]|uniref:DUF3592 domain-containing protein n=1 Tax=Leisingera sp. S132 TaxID=2867016 RepID=UPI0021A96C35|nr:DUF3592 domain-containing protein [Leisingera sp. S132]UWQ80115.1 DUF3592 domain-containing protein [Leisingera sp. S132]
MNAEIYQPGDPVADILFNWSPLVAAALACAFGAVLLHLGFWTYVKAAWLKRSGVECNARVTGKWLKKGYADRRERDRAKPAKYHYLQFERTEGGRIYSAKDVAPIALWEEVEPGDQVAVVHLPGRALMRLSGWPDHIGRNAGVFQMAAGGLITAFSASIMISGALAALGGPEYQEIGSDWIRDQAVVQRVGTPADPYIRLFAPDKIYVHVNIGDTQGGRLMANQRLVLLSPEQFAGARISENDVLKAWVDPAQANNAVLDMELDRSLR